MASRKLGARIAKLQKKRAAGNPDAGEKEYFTWWDSAAQKIKFAQLSPDARAYGDRWLKRLGMLRRCHPELFPGAAELKRYAETALERVYGRDVGDPVVEPEPVIPAPPEPAQDAQPHEAIETAPAARKRRLASPDHLREYGGAGRLEPTEEQLAEILEFDLPGH